MHDCLRESEIDVQNDKFLHLDIDNQGKRPYKLYFLTCYLLCRVVYVFMGSHDVHVGTYIPTYAYMYYIQTLKL